MSDNSNENLSVSEVRAHFDEILVKHIARLIEIDSNSATLSFNLATITCLLLAVERDKEIANFPDMPPERYNRATFLKEIETVGLDIDDDLMVAFQALTQYGYVVIGSDDLYYSQISAFALVNFLDNLFPGMPGINLVAYVIQHIDEVVSGRVELYFAKEKFEQTLVTRGVALSEQTMKKDEKIITQVAAKKGVADLETGKSKQEIKELKKTFSKRLEKLRTISNKQPVTTSKETYAQKVGKVKSIFSQQDDPLPDDPAVKTEDDIKPDTELDRIKEELRKREDELKRIEEEERKKQEGIKLKEQQEHEQEKERLRQEEIDTLKSEMAKKEAEKKAHQDEMKKMMEQLESQNKTDDITEKESTTKEDDIERRISSLASEIPISCPLCTTGHVEKEITDQNKEYYECKNDACNFISWSKPYQHTCPLCSNNYLVENLEMISGTPVVGLKCPRAGCSYQQHHVNSPVQNTTSDSSKPKKKRRVIKRVKRKK